MDAACERTWWVGAIKECIEDYNYGQKATTRTRRKEKEPLANSTSHTD